MDCSSFQGFMNANRRPQDCARAEVAAVAQHWGRCDECKAYLRSLKKDPFTAEELAELAEFTQAVKADPECRSILRQSDEEFAQDLAEMDSTMEQTVRRLAKDASTEQLSELMPFLGQKAEAAFREAGATDAQAHNLALMLSMGGMVLSRWMMVIKHEKKESGDV